MDTHTKAVLDFMLTMTMSQAIRYAEKDLSFSKSDPTYKLWPFQLAQKKHLKVSTDLLLPATGGGFS